MSPHRFTLNTKRISELASSSFFVGVVAIVCLVVPTAARAAGCPNEKPREESLVNPSTGQPYSMQLPDCRAYELVSPPSTGGMPAILGPAYADAGLQQFLTTDGAVFWLSQATPPDTGAAPDGGYLDAFRSHRTSSGWRTSDVLPSSVPGEKDLVAASRDGTSALIETTLTLSPTDLDNPTGNVTQGYDLYVVREGHAPEMVTRGELPNTLLGQGHVGTEPLWNSELTAIGFTTPDSLANPISNELATPGCYIWTDAEPRLATLTNLDESGTLTPGRNCEYFGVGADGTAILRVTAIGREGTGAIFAVDPASSETLESGGTRRLAGPDARFDAMSPSGSAVYVTSPEPLTPEGVGEASTNVYAIGLDGLPSVCVSCRANGAPNATAATFIEQSRDGTHLYFSVDDALYQYDPAGTQRLGPASDDLQDLVPSENGQYVIALTPVPLSASDTDGVTDLYELRVGSAPTLITGGSSASALYQPIAVSDTGGQVLYDDRPSAGGSEVIDEWSAGQTLQLSPDGATTAVEALGTTGPELEDVFFVSHEPLVGQDDNAGTTDVYDARADGGFPAPSATTPAGNTPNPGTPALPPYPANTGSSVQPLAPLAAGAVALRPARDARLPRPLKAKTKSTTCKRGRARHPRRCAKRKVARKA